MTSAGKANPSVVLVHGAYADGSSWSEVIKRLHGAGITATAVQNPLTSLVDDVAHTDRIPGAATRPGDLGGSLIRRHRDHPGRHPAERGGTGVYRRQGARCRRGLAALASRYPAPPASAGLVYTSGFGALTEDAFVKDFANSTRNERLAA
jgi:hypothetical protein